MSGTLLASLATALKGRDTWAKLSRYIRRAQASGQIPTISTYTVEAATRDALPSPQQRADAFIEWLGSADVQPGEYVKPPVPEMLALLGTEDPVDGKQRGYAFVAMHCVESGLVEYHKAEPGHLRLTMRGWSRFDELTRNPIESKTAFMAMQFGTEPAETAYKTCFIAAVDKAGFKLRRLDSFPKAGLIDVRMRVEIRTAKFLIADLTDENRGAYWESGFAEGLGRPVIYTCEKSKFARAKTHFDTEHLLHVLWEADKLDAAKEELKAVIRNTFPQDAKMVD